VTSFNEEEEAIVEEANKGFSLIFTTLELLMLICNSFNGVFVLENDDILTPEGSELEE
jgi:hypothetical protein